MKFGGSINSIEIFAYLSKSVSVYFSITYYFRCVFFTGSVLRLNNIPQNRSLLTSPRLKRILFHSRRHKSCFGNASAWLPNHLNGGAIRLSWLRDGTLNILQIKRHVWATPGAHFRAALCHDCCDITLERDVDLEVCHAVHKYIE